MKAVILAGGLGTRLSEETAVRPKPMVEIGGRPMLWHIMKLYGHHGVNDFVICLGYRGYVIKEYFANYFLHNSDVTFDMSANAVQYHSVRSEPWRVTLVDTGDHTMTGGRVKRVRDYLEDDGSFCLTYGDGLADVDISAEISQHRQSGATVTMTVVRPPARFGRVALVGTEIREFEEKPQAATGFINGGFFVMNPDALDYIDGDATSLEREPLSRIAERGLLSAWRHDGFWQPMDTLREKNQLEDLWQSGEAPWKVWV